MVYSLLLQLAYGSYTLPCYWTSLVGIEVPVVGGAEFGDLTGTPCLPHLSRAECLVDVQDECGSVVLSECPLMSFNNITQWFIEVVDRSEVALLSG